MVTVSVAVLVPVVTAAAGVVSLRAQDRRVRRSRAGRRRLAFEDATRQVAFATEWWKAKQLTAGTPEALENPTEVANGWLDEASAQVNAAEQADTNEEPSVSVSRLLLLYRFHRRSAKAIRIGFYAALGFMASVITVVLNDAESREDVGFTVWVLASSGMLALFLRFWAVSADSPAPDQR
ncbi:hypothetical protein [Streptomyces sp. AK08-02]|uniref:hypothetical protein n=1 Tax=Streptomyces sp. AK08-02 TaxID=3028654 RepID=UPI0029AA5941|nr:hypothetical protein [Streptomyces sp. AK08-02]MDX3749566.1 hypothetical protein [Streptomyces sp. AK08-02]